MQTLADPLDGLGEVGLAHEVAGVAAPDADEAVAKGEGHALAVGDAAGLDARVRPEQLTLADFAALDAALRAVR